MNEHHHEQHPAEQPPSPPEQERALRLQPKVWIGSLADYNNGALTCDWVDAAVTDEELVEAAKAIVARSDDPSTEEWAIFDYEDFETWKPGEYEDLSIVSAVARGILEHGPAFAAWADLHDADPDMMTSFEDAFLGEFDSAEAWAESMLEDLGSREEIDRLLAEKVGDLARYVRLDTAAWARDAWLSGDVAIVHKARGRRLGLLCAPVSP